VKKVFDESTEESVELKIIKMSAAFLSIIPFFFAFSRVSISLVEVVLLY
jgi:hypothetical protein